MDKFMVTGENDLFQVNADERVYLHCIGVQDVTFLKPRKANVTLVAHTPDAIMTLMNLPNDITLEIVNHCSGGKRDEYAAEDVIIRMSHCKFYERWFQDLVPIYAADSERVTLYAEIVCELEVLLDR